VPTSIVGFAAMSSVSVEVVEHDIVVSNTQSGFRVTYRKVPERGMLVLSGPLEREINRPMRRF
jgi:hypothetical protein